METRITVLMLSLFTSVISGKSLTFFNPLTYLNIDLKTKYLNFILSENRMTIETLFGLMPLSLEF